MFHRAYLRCHRFFSGYFTQLMVFLFLLFVFRPYEWGRINTAVWELFFTGVFVSSIFNAHHPRKVKIVAICLSIPALFFDWVSILYPYQSLILLNLLFTILFLFVCTSSVLYNVVLRGRVTLETLRGVICAYFMIGFVFAFGYLLLEFLVPGSFRLLRADPNFSLHSLNLSQMMYFSFIVLLTVGFGDITPLSDLGQSLVVIEAVIGQFYVAILVARIVSIYAIYNRRDKHQG
jgi:voltage-gated potassium channel